MPIPDWRRGLLGSWPVRGVELVVNLVLLSLVVIIGSIPLLTVPAAIGAAFAVVRDWTRLGETAVLRPFARHFRRSVGPGVLLFVPYSLLALIISGNLWLSIRLQPVGLRLPVLVVSVAMDTAAVAIAVILGPVLVHYEAGLIRAFRHTVVEATLHPVAALASVVTVVAYVLLGLFVPLSPLITTGSAIYAIQRIWEPLFAQDEGDVPRASPDPESVCT